MLWIIVKKGSQHAEASISMQERLTNELKHRVPFRRQFW